MQMVVAIRLLKILASQNRSHLRVRQGQLVGKIHLKLIGTATTTQYQQILRSIQYQNISASPAYGTIRTINFTAGDVLPLYPCGSTDAHFYKFISAPAITWQNAKIAAETQNYFGMKGYLATISCVQENNFAFNSIAQKGWIGASDDVAFTGAYSPNGEGQWYWVTGPEAGTRFWQGNQPGSPVGGLYNNWDVGEPNNFQNTNESFAHLLENGRWNDYTFNNSSIVGYFIEFGGLPTDPNVQTTTSKQIQIATKPDFFLSGQVCIDAPPITLLGLPTGGIFKINGNVSTNFNPSVLGVGTHTVVYELTGCTVSASKIINVIPLPAVSISGLQASYCSNVATVALTGLPAGGTFTVNGGIATQFSPSTAGVGNYTIKYIFTNGNGCTNSTTQDIVVVPFPTAQLTSLNDSYCITQASFALQGTPTGGTFKINTFDATVFDAQTLGAGIYTVTYTVTNGVCNDTDTKTVEVFALPVLSFVNVPDEYCLQAVPIVLQASPTGGAFSLNGVVSNVFNPANYAVGDEVVIKYEYSVLAGCSNSLTKTIKIIFSSSFEQASFEVEVCPSEGAGKPLEALSVSEEQALRTANGNIRYEWSNGETSRIIFITQQDIYKVLVKSESGCPLRNLTFNTIVACNTKFFIPNAFTPNGDGRNDKWEIFGGDITKLDLRVYNRWGELVFMSNSMENWWDGTVGDKPAPEGVYVWAVSYENPLKKGIIEKQQGKVTILR
jgi:gliding motility-associated-like protein